MKVFGNFNPIVNNDAMSFEILDSKNIFSDCLYTDIPVLTKENIWINYFCSHIGHFVS
jgi:hypothetical protein